MYTPSDFIQLAALQHYLYCPRQCALIHLEQIWTENTYTAEGHLLHAKADSGQSETRGDIKTVTGLLLCSHRLGLSGKADVVEFHRQGKIWQPYPVEYKRGQPKKHLADHIQLCAQAMCLEEMLGLDVPEGALFYGKTHRRQQVALNAELRELTVNTAQAVHDLLGQGRTPPPLDKNSQDRCRACSLLDECLPTPLTRKGAAQRYLAALQEEL